MSLSREIAAAVDRTVAEGVTLDVVAVEDGPHRLAVALTTASPVGVAFDHLEYCASGRPERSAEDLRAWGDRLAARLTYLMEPLVVLEVDPVGGEATLRSQSPTLRHGHRSYYEIRLDRRGTLRLGRVAFDEATRRRRPASCQFTREVLERLADDLVACVG